MKKAWNEMTQFLQEYSESLNTRETILTILLAFLGGLVLGMIFSPKHTFMVGSNNGSNNVTHKHGCLLDDDEEESDEDDWED